MKRLDLVRASSILTLAVAGCSASHLAGGDAGLSPSDSAASDAAPTDGGPAAPSELRFADRALVEWLASSADEPWWIEERLAPQPSVEGDHDLGPRAIARAAPGREVVWLPPASDRLTDACRHASGEWSAVGVEADGRIFLARGDASGPLDRIVLDDPELATDARAWLDGPGEVLQIGALSEASPSIAADGEDVVVTLMTDSFAVLAYRWTREGGAFVRGPRTLVSPSMHVTPILPIGGSYDDFDAVVAPYVPRLATDREGHAFVAMFADRNRLARHNAILGTELDLLREALYPRENTLDVLVSRIDRDGSVAYARVVGTVDVEDEVFGIVAGETRVAVLGRSRRELGRDNTELHAMIAELAIDGTPLGTITFDAADSALAQTGAYAGEDLWVGGAEGWLQNPSGRSVYDPGVPFLVRLRGAHGGRTLERAGDRVPETSGHAELRAVAIEGGILLLGGHENGPLTHTGDGDPSRIRSDAYGTLVPLP